MKRTEPPPSFINYPALQERRAGLGLYVQDLIDATGMSSTTVSAILNGEESVNLQSIVRLAEELELRVRVEFEPVGEAESEEDRATKARPFRFPRRRSKSKGARRDSMRAA